MRKVGVLLMNIGTPAGADVNSVKKYLSEFLTDRDVINAPWIVREILFNRIIVPLRAKKSAKKYQSIWTDKGSPLMVYSQKFSKSLQEELGEDFVVAIGMRYGAPSISSSIQKMIDEKVEKIILVPLYPQFAQATTGSSLSKAYEVLKSLQFRGEIQVTGDFYKDDDFIKSWVESLQLYQADHWLFSFHGLPVNQIKKNHGCYAQSDCCQRAIFENRRCYKAQCLKTANDIAEGLGLKNGQWSVSFQSRLGPVKWIEPYTDQTLIKLAQSGKKKLVVCAPAFVVDGLETLEELNIEGRKIFEDHGGEQLVYVPCLNDSQAWVKRFSKIILKL